MKFSSTALFCSLLLGVSFDNYSVTAEEFECGAFCDFHQRDIKSLNDCLNNTFVNNTVGTDENGKHKKWAITPIEGLSASAGALYNNAKRTTYGTRNPAAIVFAENKEDVVEAIGCAREAGYKVTARGRGHSYDGWGAADGSLIIDMQYTCNVTSMIESIDRSKHGPHLIQGTQYIATIKAQAGCSNINWLAAVYKGFQAKDGAIASIGSCPSVGIVGYSLGGGLGDTSPISGYALDLVTEYEMVLHDGSIVTASEDENADLYWANRGGGGGNGVITLLTFKVVQNPSPEKAFTYLLVNVYNNVTEWFVQFQNFLYDNEESYRFGGNAFPVKNSTEVQSGLKCLGTAQECVKILTDAGLMNQDEFSSPASKPTYFTNDYNAICDGNPESGIPLCEAFLGSYINQFKTQGEMQAFETCTNWFVLATSTERATARTLNVCDDLGINDTYCSTYCELYGINVTACPAHLELGTSMHIEFMTCGDKVVIDAILEKASNPTSFISRHGSDVNVQRILSATPSSPSTISSTTGGFGGFVLPRLEDDTIRKIIPVTTNIGNHLAHGASHMVAKDATAMPWRKSVFQTGQAFATKEVIKILLEDESIQGDPTKIQGYYSYIGPASLPNWERFYFGDNVAKLQEIKAKHDPTGLFDKPMQISGTNTKKESTKVSKESKSHTKKVGKGKKARR